MVRVVNFTTYNASKRAISDTIFQATGFDALEHYAQPGSRPTIASVVTFTAAGMLAGLASAPIACEFL